MLIFNNIFYKNKKSYLNKVLNNTSLCLIKRFTGNKPVGHAQKILNSISNKPKPTELPVFANKPTVNDQIPSIKSNKQTTEKISSKVNTFSKTSLKIESIKDQVPKGMPSGKYGLFDYATPKNNHSKIPSQDSFAKKPTNVNNENNIKPSNNTIKSKSGKEFTTKITEKTDSNSITDSELICEMQNRELIKPDADKTAVILKDCNNNTVLIGESKNKVKLTALGQAYSSIVKKNTDIIATTNNVFNFDPGKSHEFNIIFPPPRNNDLFIETGNQKHLIIVHNTITQKTFGLGYLTSKISGIFLSDTQFKKFQNNLDKKNNSSEENSNQIHNGKTQHFFEFGSLQEIREEDVNPVKGGKEYLNFIDQLGVFTNILRKNDEKPYAEFNKNGLTKDNCIQMCVEHDNFVKNKQPHPLTDDQIKQQILAKNKQKEEQLTDKKDVTENS